MWRRDDVPGYPRVGTSMKLIIGIMLMAGTAFAAPPADNAKPVAVVKLKKPQTCTEARQAQAATSEGLSYPDSYRSAEELRREIQNHVKRLCDEPVGDFGARATWEEIDGAKKEEKKAKPHSGSVRQDN